MVEESAVVNHAQLVGTQDGTTLVPTYNWAEFFYAPFRQTALKGIKSMHHLTFTSSKPGSVVVKDTINSPEWEINMIVDSKWRPRADQLPPIISPSGLSKERKQYLFEKIREYCPPHCQDLVYPDPALEYESPRPLKDQGLNSSFSTTCRSTYT